MAVNQYGDKEHTPDWNLYLAGRRYNNRLEPPYYSTVGLNLSFFEGNQWLNLTETNMPKPVINIIKRFITFFVASLTSSAVKINFTPLMYADENPDEYMMSEAQASEFVTTQIASLLEKFKIEYRIRDALFDAAITGDAAMHFYFDTSKKPYGGQYAEIRGEICMELVDGVNVMFGNANNHCVEEQPYIIVIGRTMVQDLKTEARRWRKMQQEPLDESEERSIASDSDFLYQAGEQSEIEIEDFDEYGKALYIVVYRKVVDPETEEVRILASKSVQNAYIFKDVDTGMSRYPLSWLNWERQKNQYHGRAVCTGILPNQIVINRMFAMVTYHLMMTAFPKAVYNSDYIATWNNTVGAAIPISGLGDTVNVQNLAGYLPVGDISPNLFKVIDQLMQFTKETIGITDAALGNIDPKNTSATIAVQKSSAIPLGNPRANLYEFMEDIGNILLDMMATYYGERPVAMKHEGKTVVHPFDFSALKQMALNTKVDVGEASYWSEITSVQTLDNLLAQQHIDIIQYLERLPNELPQKEALITELRERAQAMADQAAMEAQVQAEQQQAVQQTPQQVTEQAPQQEMDIEAILSQLSPEEQQAFQSASPDMQQQMIAALIK